jgi:hypothetical protein
VPAGILWKSPAQSPYGALVEDIHQCAYGSEQELDGHTAPEQPLLLGQVKVAGEPTHTDGVAASTFAGCILSITPTRARNESEAINKRFTNTTSSTFTFTIHLHNNPTAVKCNMFFIDLYEQS